MVVHMILITLFLTAVLAVMVSSHPMMLGLFLLLMIISGSIMLGTLTNSFWLTYVIVMIFLGGLLIIFLYIALLASNEMFYWKNYNLIAIPLVFMYLTLSLKIFQHNSISLKLDNMNDLTWINSLYESELWLFILFLGFYLFLTLLVVVFNTKSQAFSLRSN